MCKNPKLYFIESSIVYLKGKRISIDKYRCSQCKGLCILNRKTNKKISFDGGIGKEC